MSSLLSTNAWVTDASCPMPCERFAVVGHEVLHVTDDVVDVAHRVANLVRPSLNSPVTVARCRSAVA